MARFSANILGKTKLPILENYLAFSNKVTSLVGYVFISVT